MNKGGPVIGEDIVIRLELKTSLIESIFFKITIVTLNKSSLVPLQNRNTMFPFEIICPTNITI